ncbi:hypothetical protein CONLIGDRAFT_669066 [Coniochaeta ligniaria NRRL 30616]|uniref:Uncharacterized protein n=1 Tax=Coniochaeta ligniaria NRRL 30616 TaxID=1408157 RepID=A0A1J7IVQ7_9PEZI|nr:hypothetical protein CONLIGDRAFT_669066 [Coniochaeta ligniaria NRRL 30616]
MPFFSRHEPEPAPVVEQAPRKHGLFSSRQEPAPVVQQQQPKKHGLFGHRDPSPVSSHSASSYNNTTNNGYTTSPQRHSTDASGKRHSGLLSKFGGGDHMDPSIVQARERVIGAEAAEREADRALMAARESVRNAREHVRRLELEAEEEARLAKIKQHQAKDISKRGKQLGRHGI